MAQPEKSAAAVHAKAMLEALKEILKSQNSGIPLTLLVPELSLYLYQSSHFTCTRALTLLTICYALVYLLCQVTVVSLGFRVLGFRF